MIRSEAVAGPPYLLFVGDGDQRGPLEEVAREMQLDAVRFLGFKNQSELPAYYDLCEVFVLPSVFEPWGLAVNEVMNAGRAVIVSDQVGCGPDLVRNGENGFIFEAGDTRPSWPRPCSRDPASRDHCRRLGQNSLKIIARCSLEAELQGLKLALNAVLPEPPRKKFMQAD